MIWIMISFETEIDIVILMTHWYSVVEYHLFIYLHLFVYFVDKG